MLTQKLFRAAFYSTTGLRWKKYYRDKEKDKERWTQDYFSKPVRTEALLFWVRSKSTCKQWHENNMKRGTHVCSNTPKRKKLWASKNPDDIVPTYLFALHQFAHSARWQTTVVYQISFQ